MRKLVTVRKIDSIQSIKDADAIEQVNVGGWTVVAQKGIHHEGDLVLYFELDSFLPQSDVRFESFMKFGTNTFNGVVGHRVKTKRLRGVYSQGIIMPIREFPEVYEQTNGDPLGYDIDYAELVGVVKYERSEVTGNGGQPKGSLPWFIKKTDQERLQNLYNNFSDEERQLEFVATLKLDGSSVQVFCANGERYDNKGLGFCSRNQELKFETEDSDKGKFQQGIENSKLFEKVAELCRVYGGNYAIQGELVGPGIQGNFEKFDVYKVFAYNIFDIDKQQYVPYDLFWEMCNKLDIEMVPQIGLPSKILLLPLQEIIKMADGKGLQTAYREGIVYKQLDGDLQFKVISNVYLDKEK